MKSTTIETENYSITLVPASYGPLRKTRIYGFGTPDMERPAYSIKGDDAELDAAWRKYNREEIKAMRANIDAALVELAEHIAFSEIDGYNFSRKAGCSCPCSPGFIADRSMIAEGIGRLTQISIGPKKVEEPADERTYTFADFDLFPAN